MTHPPFRSELDQLQRGSRHPLDSLTGAADPEARRRAAEVEAVVRHLEPIRSRTSLLSSFAREAAPSEPVRAAYAIRWAELGSGIPASRIARARGRRVNRPIGRRRAA